MTHPTHFDEPKVQALIRISRVVVLTIVSLGIAAAIATDSGKWIDRSGKLVVAVSLFLIFIQFRYEEFFAKSGKSESSIVDEIEEKGAPKQEASRIAGQKVEETKDRFEIINRRVTLHSLFTAGVGEVIAAFGDVGYSLGKSWFAMLTDKMSGS